MSKKRGRPAYGDVLTPGEWRVAEGVRHGMTNRAIAERQGVSVDAVKYHVANIMAKLGFARRAELRQWSGVRIDSNLANASSDPEPGAFVAVGQIARSVADIDTARRWYAEKLGLLHLYSFGKLVFFDCGGVRLMLSEGDGVADSIIYFCVPDIRAAHLALAGRGVEFLSAPHLIHRHDDGNEEWMAFFKDPEGRPLAMMAQMPDRSAPSADEET